MRVDIEQLRVRHKLERFLVSVGGTLHGAGTDLTNGVMDVSFEVDNVEYTLTLKTK